MDGREAAVGRAQYTLIGVPLPAGARQVELTFREAAYERGKLLTLAALALTAVLIAGGVVVERRRRG